MKRHPRSLTLALFGMATLIGVTNSTLVHAQSAPIARQKFEVASIRPGCGGGDTNNTRDASKGGGASEGWSPGRLNLCGTLKFFITMAYVTFQDGRLTTSRSYPPEAGGPAWIDSDRYRINTKAPPNVSRETMQGPMLQSLLEDRFRLKVRREKREVPIYALTIAKGGLKLKRVQSCAPVDPANPPPPPAPGQDAPGFREFCSRFSIGGNGSNRTLDMHAMNMTEFSQTLSMLDRPVIDRTGVKGMFDFHLEFAQDETTPHFLPFAETDGSRTREAAPTTPPSGPSIFTAVREQLGLKLDHAKGPREFLVIDRAERPSEN